jgi:predicted GNAT superfamily acetyltransferase
VQDASDRRGGIRVREGTIDEAFDVFMRVPELDGAGDRAEWIRRLDGASALVLVAVRDDRAVAFKVGYDRYRDGSWYSWLGGVEPAVRGTGVARALLERQETWVKAHGYRRIHVKTRNRFVAMRVLLARAGYSIVAVEAPAPDTPVDDLRLILVKDL